VTGRRFTDDEVAGALAAVDAACRAAFPDRYVTVDRIMADPAWVPRWLRHHGPQPSRADGTVLPARGAQRPV
jgi:hypothetical protein